MKKSHLIYLLIPLLLARLGGVSFADPVDVPDRAASFLPAGTQTAPQTAPAFSGLAAASIETPPPPQAVLIAPPPAVTEPAPSLIASPVAIAPLADISPESLGDQSTNSLGATMWKGTPRAVAEYLISIAVPTSSSTLNLLAKRLLTTAATPPEGTSNGAQGLTVLRLERLLAFGATVEAWSLAKHADPKLIDDESFRAATEAVLSTESEDPCPQIPEFAKNRAAADWQEALTICHLRAKDMPAVQVSLDILRGQTNRDEAFLSLVDKNILGNIKTLPYRLTPLTHPLLALLHMIGLPMPSELYRQTDLALAPALLRAVPKQDVAQLAQMALAERAAERGVISTDALATVYRTVSFALDELAAPLTAHESGLRLRALLFRVGENEKDPQKRIAYAVAFAQSATPAFLNGAGAIIGDLLGTVKADTPSVGNAVTLARLYMLAGRGEDAANWLKLARLTSTGSDELRLLWPQFVLAGLEPEETYAADFSKWLEIMLKPADQESETRGAREKAAASLLLLDAAGFSVPDSAWTKLLIAPHNEKRIAFSPVLFDRLQAAGAAGRRAETVLLSLALADEGAIPLPSAVAITRALRHAGFKNEAGLFARQTLALMSAAP